MIGKTISHYKITEKLGEGGMGVVYKAFDTKLEREVALKLLRPEAMGDPVAKKRFIREAKAASALNHPNITTIHEIDEWHGLDFICMEYIQGETVKKKIQSGQMSMDEVLNIAAQTADALQEAHEHDITHRDIKSENIMVTPKGQVKVMDFGLAKLKGVGGLTKNGMTMGTISYMSPEQARGEDVDHRTDIWSFGVVLYEMITGKLPFKGGYEQAVIYSILNEEPESVQKYRPNLSFEFLHLLNKALKKNCEDRYLWTQDMLKDLKRLKKSYEKESRVHSIPIPEIKQPDEVEKGVSFRPRSRKLIGLNILFFISLIAIVIIFITKPFIKESKLPMKITPVTNFPGPERYPSFAPYGNQIAFVWCGETQDNYDIYVKPIGEGQPYRVTTHSGWDYGPTWSPDGNIIAFVRYKTNESGIYSVPFLGGTERKLHAFRFEINYGWTYPILDWSPNGELLAFSDKHSSDSPRCVYVLSVQNQNLKKLTSPPIESIGDAMAKFSPDGKMLAFIRYMSYYTGNIFILHLNDNKMLQLTFDNDCVWSLAWTSDSKELIYSSNRRGIQSLWRIPVGGGEPEPFVASAINAWSLAISRDGKKLAYEEKTIEPDIWRVNLSNLKEKPTKIIYSRAEDHTPRYSPDGKKIVFGSHRSGFPEIWLCDSSGKNPVQLTKLEGHHSGAPCWSPDGNFIAFDSRLESHGDIFIIDVKGGSFKRITHDPSDDSNPYWSRDGKWIYFLSDCSGSYQIWKVPVIGGKAIQVTSKGGGSAVESYDGRWLYYDYNNLKSEKPRGIWKISVDGGEEHCVLDIDIDWRQWALANDGIYYVKWLSIAHYSLEFFSFRSGDVKKLGEINLDAISSTDVSPDQRYLIIDAYEKECDIILVENFQ